MLTRRQINLVFGTIMLGMLLAAPRPDDRVEGAAHHRRRPRRRRARVVGGHVSWVVTSYLLTDTIATVLAGKFGDLFGRN